MPHKQPAPAPHKGEATPEKAGPKSNDQSKSGPSDRKSTGGEKKTTGSKSG